MPKDSHKTKQSGDLDENRPSKKRKVIYLEATKERDWIYEILLERSVKNDVSLAQECYSILAAYLVKMYDPQFILKMKRKVPVKKSRANRKPKKYRF